jgi:tetratricopeptide (TPR) repeat protein
MYKAAIKYCEQSLKIKPDNFVSLYSYGVVLDMANQYEKAIDQYEKALKIKPNSIEVLNNYGGVLRKLDQYTAAIDKFKQILESGGTYDFVLYNYGLVLQDMERHEEAIEKFEQALKIKPDAHEILTNCGLSLDKIGQHELAIKKFEQALKIKPNDFAALNNYGISLLNLGEYKLGTEKFEQILKIEPDNIFALINYANALALAGKYEKAIEKIEPILNTIPNYLSSNFLYLKLGHLYYLAKSDTDASKYFRLAIENSDDKDAARIKIAQDIFTANPYSQKGIDILKEIADSSPSYAEAFKMLSLNLSPKEYWEMFRKVSNADYVRDTEILNRSIYHKIKNEVSILKGIAYRIIYQSQAKDEILSEIIHNIEHIIEQINDRREQEKAEVKNIPDNEYEKLIDIISETAHDISDFVINELAAIESKIRRIMWKMPKDDARYPQFEKLLQQLEFTQNAINDLKSVNQGINIRYNRFQVKKLFEKWEKNQNIANASILLHIEDGEAEFNGDEEKIKSALNELIENSIKHNPEQTDLQIKIIAKIGNRSGSVIPLRQQSGLFIEFSDNGKGIPPEKKEQIFLPLETTSKDGEGSGLGLFIIKKTLTEMKGSIQETGENGARFEINIPYMEEEESGYAEADREYLLAVG